MKKVVVILALAALAIATSPSFTFDNLIALTPPEYLPKLFGGNAAVGNECPNEQMILKANTDWLMYLGINTAYTWKNATSLWVIIKTMLKTDDVNVLQKVCRSRDLFYITLGQENYYHCINIYGLMHYTQDWNTAAYYVRMWSHLDFMCNIGYQQFMDKSTWTCLASLNQNEGCNTAYVNGVTGHWDNMCPYVKNYTQCVKQATDLSCNKPNGYFACEDIRLGYGRECDIRCQVN